jgi:hypothetical protein
MRIRMKFEKTLIVLSRTDGFELSATTLDTLFEIVEKVAMLFDFSHSVCIKHCARAQ